MLLQLPEDQDPHPDLHHPGLHPNLVTKVSENFHFSEERTKVSINTITLRPYKKEMNHYASPATGSNRTSLGKHHKKSTNESASFSLSAKQNNCEGVCKELRAQSQ